MKNRILLLFAGLLSLFGCRPAGPADPAGRPFCDDYGRTVTVPTAPRRIVSASNSVTEIVYALGAGDLLVGRTDFCTYPPEARKLPSIGGITNMSVESILALSPDLVISSSMVQKKNVLQLEKMGVPLVSIVEKQHFDALFDNIEAIGTLIGREAAADSLNRSLRARLRQVQDSIVPGADRPTAYYVVGFGDGGNFTAGGNTFINDIIAMAGGRNAAAGSEGWSYSLETLMQQDPAYIVIRREDSAAFCRTEPYSRLTAVKAGRVIPVESGTIDIQGPRNIDAVRLLAKHFRQGQ